MPLLMRGPGIPAGQRRTQTVATIDLAPTIAELAGARPMRRTDGRSLLPYAVADRPQPDRALLVQAGSKGKVEARARTFRGVRTDRYTLVRWTKPRFRELYDRHRNPRQLTDVHRDPRYRRIRRHLTALLRDRPEDCRGRASRRPVPELSRPGRR